LAAGETAFRKCQNKLGPDKAGTVEGYAYSDADKNSGIVWSEASFKEYLGEPARKDARDKGDPIRQETRRSSRTCGPISSSLEPTGRRKVSDRFGKYMSDLRVVATPREEIVMPIIATVILVLFGLCSITAAARAEPANACKQCRDQQQACTKNYSAKTCKTEYDICMKSCQK
jgi:hypothetical protein